MHDRDKAMNVIRWLKGGKIPPYQIEIIPTNGCNLDCSHCVLRGKPEHKPEEEMSDAEISRVVAEAACLGVKYVHISGGGEPLFRKETAISMIREIRKKGMMCSMVTNGTLFDEESVRELVEIGMNQIVFSINGADDKTDDIIRCREGAFALSSGAVKLFAGWKERLNRVEPKLIVAPVISSQNYRSLPQMAKNAASWGAQELLAQPMTVRDTPEGRKLMLDDRMKEEFAAIVEEAKAVADSLGICTNLSQIDSLVIDKSTHMDEVVRADSEKNPGDELLSIPCYTPWFFMNIRSNGLVEPCGVHAESSESIREKSLEAIWYGRYFDEFRKQLMAGSIPKRCERCCAASVLGMTRQLRDEFVRLRDRNH
ncbi:MAG: radical SAM protein [archaeon]